MGINRELVILRDLYGRTGRKDKNYAIVPFGKEVTNENDERIIDLYKQYQLKITNEYFQQGK